MPQRAEHIRHGPSAIRHWLAPDRPAASPAGPRRASGGRYSLNEAGDIHAMVLHGDQVRCPRCDTPLDGIDHGHIVIVRCRRCRMGLTLSTMQGAP